MNIQLSDEEMALLLEEMGKAHAVAFMMGKDASKIEKLIQVIHKQLKTSGKLEIFDKVFVVRE